MGDAKNLRRILLLSVQLAEMGLPMVVCLNMTDEAAQRGIRDGRSLAGYSSRNVTMGSSRAARRAGR